MALLKRARKPMVQFCVLLFCLGSGGGAIQGLRAEEWSEWRYRVDTIVQPQIDDSYQSVYADFTRLLKHDLGQTAAFDPNSIRVVASHVVAASAAQPGTTLPFRFIPDSDYDAARNARGTLVFLVPGSADATPKKTRIFFDTAENPRPLPPQDGTVPEKANLIWNSGFEILTKEYVGSNKVGSNKYANGSKTAPQAMPQGWWGGLIASGLNAQSTETAHSGKHALAFSATSANKLALIKAVASPVGSRVIAGQTYTFALWAKGEKLMSGTGMTGTLGWLGSDAKPLKEIKLIGLPPATPDFGWTKVQMTLTAPPEAAFAVMTVGTLSTTGAVIVDDFQAAPAVPVLLENAEPNQR